MNTVLARKAWNLFIAALYAFNLLVGTVAPVSAQEAAPAPTVTTDRADYSPGDIVTITGANWQGDASVRVQVNDEIGQAWMSDTTTAVVEGGFSTAVQLPLTFISIYTITATGVDTNRVVTAYFTDAPALTLAKTASPLTYTAAGQTITFSYALKNTGTTILNGPFTVTDNKVPSVSCPATATLAVGASITCTGTYSITAADMALGYAVNTATASSSNPEATTSNQDVRIVSFPVTCHNDSNGADDVPGQKDLTMACNAPTAVNPEVISWNWDVTSMSGNNSADACSLFDTDNDGLANYALCVSWQGNRIMQAGYPVLYSCGDGRSDRCTNPAPLTISNGTACAVELADDQPFPGGESSPNDAKAFCSINLADVGGVAKSTLIDVCSYPSQQPNSDPSDCVLISTSKGNLEVIKNVVPDDPNTNWNMSWTGPTPYTGTITGDGTTGIQTVSAGSYSITEAAGTGTDLSLYDATWACTVNGAASASGSGTTISGVSVAKGDVVICTFTNTRKTGSLEIKKDVVPDNPSTNWNFTVSGPSVLPTCTITGDGSCGAKAVATGSYSITETAGSGTNLGDYGTSYACTVNGSAGSSGSGASITGLTINKSDVVVCTFTNSQSPGTLTVNKVVLPSTDTGKFNLLIDGTAKATDVGDGGTTGAISLSAGSHTVSESAGTGTDLNNYVTTITGDCDSSGNVSVGPNQAKTCTITNTRKGTIIVEKQTDPDGAAGSFSFTGDAAGTISDNGQIVVSNLAPGTYTATESSLAADFALQSISCDDGSSATPSTFDLASKTATFKLDPGETVKCTFTNKKLNPDLAVTKTADAAAVTAGDAVGFNISVKNNGLGTATNVTLSDTLPAIPGVTWAIASQLAGNPCTLTGASLSCSFGNLATGATAGPVHITATSTANSCGTWNNTATAQADNNTAVTGSASIFVDCATIKIAKTGNGPISAGDDISFTITVTNDNSGTAHNVTLTDTLPANPGLGAWTLGGADAGACSISGGVLTCSFGDVAGHASKTVTLTASTTAASCGAVSNTASVTTSNDGTDTSTATVTVQCPNLSVTKTPDAAAVNAGDPVGFTITVHNAGPGVAKGVTLTDTLPAGLAWTVIAPASGCSITGGVLSCSLGDLASGADASVHVTATSSPATCGPLTNTASAMPTNGAAATSGQATVTVNCADVTVTKTGNGPISAGDTATFTITVSVIGAGSLSNVTLNDPLPAGVTWAIDPAITACSISGSSPQTLSCAWATLAAGTTIQIAVSGQTSAANCAAPLSNTATVAAGNETDTTNDTASASITIDCATIQITKTAGSGTVSAGDPISFTITVSNPGPGIARNVTVTDTLPTNAGLNWSSPASCSVSGGVLTCSLGDIAGGGSKSVTLTSPTTAATCGTVENTANVTTTNDGYGEAGDSLTVQCPSLNVTKTSDAASVSSGDTIGYTITVSNAGPGEAKGVMITDSLPGGLAWTVDAANTTASGCSISGGALTCGPNTIVSGGSVKVHITAASTPAVCGTVTNTATATPTNGEAATSSTATITVLCPDLTVSKTGNGPVSAGDPASFTITVTNSGLGEAKNVTLTDILPGGLTWALDPAMTTCTITGTTPQTLSCAWATLASSASVQVTVSAVTTKVNCGTLTNSASVAASNEQNTSNNSSNNATIEVDCATIQIEKTTATPTVSAGDPISYTITVTNPGTGRADNVVVTDSLPGGLTWSIDTAGSDSGCSISGSTLTCNFGSLLSGGSKSVTVTAATTATNCGTLTNTASVTTSNDGAATTPATGITVQCPNLSVTKTADAASVSAGDTVGYTITVSNAGPGVAKGVMISDSLPGGLSWTVDAGNTTATGCAITNGVLTCGPDTIASGSSVKVHVTAASTPAVCGTLSNSATATPTNGGAATSQIETVTVYCPDLTVSKVGNGPISAGDTAAFTIHVKNTGLGEAKNVSLTDPLPSGVTWTLTSAVTGCSISDTTPQVLSCSWATLAAGADIIIIVSGPTSAAACGTLANTATITSDNEANTANNNDQDSITVNCAAIQITKVADKEMVSAGDTIGFTIEVTNPGPGTAYGVTITDGLPKNAGLNWSIDPAVIGCSITGGVLTCSVGTLAANKGFLVHISSPTTAATCGTVENSAHVTTTNDGSGDAGEAITVSCPDITVTKTALSGTISAGDPLSFTITVTNTGTGTAKGVTLSDTLPTGSGLNWSVGGADAAVCSLTAGVLTCSFGDLVTGATRTVTLTSPTTAASCSTINNTATVTATNEPSGQTNNSSTASVGVLCAAISITKTPNHTTVNAGDPASFTIIVTNTGAGTAKNISITDSLPDQPGLSWTITSIAPNDIFGSCQLNLIPPQTLTCSFDQLAAGQSVAIQVSSPTTLATACATLDNTASVTTSNDGSAQASASISVTCANISITKTPVSAAVNAGESIAYDITVTNSGLSAASGITVTDSLPDEPGLSWNIDNLSAPAGVSGSCSLNLIPPQTLRCSFDQLAAGQSITVRVSSPTTYASCGTVSNTALVTTSNDGQATTPASNITVNCPALQVTKTPDTQTVSAGDAISFTLSVTNSGAGTAKNVTLSDQLPLGVTWSVNNSSCSVNANGLLTCSFGDLASGGSASVTVTGDTFPALCGTLNNTAAVKLDNGPDAKSNTVSATVQCPDITVTKEAVSGTINAGDTAAFKIVVANIGSGTAYGVTLTDTLPAGVTWTIDPAVAVCSITGGVLSCSWPSLAASASVTINLSGPTSAATCGTLDNIVSVAANNEAANQTNNSANASITVNCSDVSVTKEAVTSPINAGDTAAFKIVVSNTGSGTAYNVTVTDTLPTGITWAIDPAVTGCAITGNTLSCSFATLAAGASLEITVKGSAPAAVCGTVTNTATVAASNETNAGNNTASATITVNCSDVTVIKTGNGPITAGGKATFTIVVTNVGAGTAYNVTVSDTLPAGIAWAIDPAVTGCAITGSTLSCSFASLAAGASIEIKVSGTAPTTSCGKLDNTVTVASSNEANTTNNSASASITVTCADVSVTKEAVTGTINAGDRAAFKIVVTNSDAGTAYNVTLTDALPAGVTWTIDPAVTGCSITGNTLSCSWATLDASASVAINISGAAPAATCGKLDNTATVAASNEANIADNTSSASITINCPDVTVTKQAVSSPINAADPAAFKIVVSNTGAGTAYNVTLTDTLPAGITWAIDPAVTGCAITGGVLSCSFASLAAGAKVEITVSGATDAADCGKLDNTATVAATNEANTTNNSASASITVNCPDVTVTKTADAGHVIAGNLAGFTIAVKNIGAGTAYNVTLTDELPSGITWTIDPAVTGCAITDGTLSCSWATLAAGASVSIHVSGATPAGVCGELTNTATVAASNEANTTNNTDTAKITVHCQTGQLLPTQTTCQMYASGNWPPMYDAFEYVIKKSKINSISPGVIFYYNTIKAPSASFTLTITEANELIWKPMLVQSGNQAYLYNADCSRSSVYKLNVAVTSTTTTVTFTVTGAMPGATYYIGIKYSPQNLVGQKVLPDKLVNEYTFTTNLNSSPQLGSEASIPVRPKGYTGLGLGVAQYDFSTTEDVFLPMITGGRENHYTGR